MKKNKIIAAAAAGDPSQVIIAAGEGKVEDLAKVNGVAYSGGTIRQFWSDHDIVLDLDGMDIAPQIPLMLNHYNNPKARLGVVSATVKDGQICIEGGIDTATDDGKEIVEKGKKYNWQLSIGASVQKTETFEEGSVDVNGKTFTAPVLVIRKAFLYEVSVVAIGADPETHLQIAAALNIGTDETENIHTTTAHNSTKGEKMGKTMTSVENTEKTTEKVEAAAVENTDLAAAAAVEAARQEEIKRIADVKAAAEGYPEIAEKAIAAGWDKDHTETVIASVKSFCKKQPEAAGNIIVRNEQKISAKALEATLCLQAGIDESSVIASCGQEAVEMADTQLRGMRLRDVMAEAARLEGKSVGMGFGNETIRAAFSTASLPGILSNVANKRALQAFNAQESIAEKLCSEGDLADFKTSERYRITDVGDLEILAEGGELKHGSMSEDKATNKLDTYGKIFVLTRQMIYNDDLGEFLKIPTIMGAKAKRKIDQVFFSRLLANPVQGDGNKLFSAKHNNFKSGATTALGVDSLEKAIALFLDQTDSDGNPIAVSPKFLLTPTVLYPVAQRLTMSAMLIGGTGTQPASNIVPNYNIQPVASPYLANTKYTGASATGFYLFGDPKQVDTFEIGYFQGRKNPTVEQGSIDFNSLDMGFRVYFDFGIKEQDHRGMVFFAGA